MLYLSPSFQKEMLDFLLMSEYIDQNDCHCNLDIFWPQERISDKIFCVYFKTQIVSSILDSYLQFSNFNTFKPNILFNVFCSGYQDLLTPICEGDKVFYPEI